MEIDEEFRDAIASETSEGPSAKAAGCNPDFEKKPASLTQDCGMQPDDERIVRDFGTSRIEPTNKSCSFADEAGTLTKGIVVNVSQIDALIKTSRVPSLASRIIFSGSPRRAAEVTRIFEIGFVAKFHIPISDEEFSDAIQFMTEETEKSEFVGQCTYRQDRQSS